MNYAGPGTCIKWPNDLYWQDRKAGGILIENVISQQSTTPSPQPEPQMLDSPLWKWAVIGIGININQSRFPAELKHAVSLSQITGKKYDAVELSKEFCSILDKNYQRLIAGESEKIIKDYNDHLYKKGERVRLKKNNRIFEALVKGVSSTGHLLTHHGIDEEFAVGEIEWLI
jgi:BirA family biotin operon repressor/biotin-[acetyl-CoA-carboxylase] ligase